MTKPRDTYTAGIKALNETAWGAAKAVSRYGDFTWAVVRPRQRINTDPRHARTNTAQTMRTTRPTIGCGVLVQRALKANRTSTPAIKASADGDTAKASAESGFETEASASIDWSERRRLYRAAHHQRSRQHLSGCGLRGWA